MFKRVFFALVLLFTGVITTTLCSNGTSALSLEPSSEIYKKIIRQNIKDCYLNEPLSSKVFPKNWPNDEYKSLFGDSKTVTMPTGYTSLKDDNIVSCKGLIYGDAKGSGQSGEYAGLLSIYGKSINGRSGLEKKKKLAVGLGYEPSSGGELDNPQAPIYYALAYTYTDNVEMRGGCKTGDGWWDEFWDQIFTSTCEWEEGPYDAGSLVTGTKVNENGAVVSNLEIFSSGNGTDLKEAGISYKENSSKSGGTLSIDCSEFTDSWGTAWALAIGGEYEYEEGFKDGCVEGDLAVSYNKTIWNDGDANTGKNAKGGSVVGFLNTHLPIEFTLHHNTSYANNTYINHAYEYEATGTISNDPNYVDRPTNVTLPGQYNKIGNWDDRATKGMQYFTGGTDRIFNDSEIYILYVGYLTDYYKADFQCGADKAEHYDGREGYVKASNILYDSQMQDECYVKATANADKKVNGVSSYNFNGNDRGGGMVFHGQKTFEELLAQIAKLSVTPESIAEANIDPNATNNDQDGEVEPTCMNTAGTSLGWILCPVLDAFGGATDWAYNQLVEPALQVKPQLFTGKGDKTRDAWRTFRDIANVFFIILFLIVIFSQLTGVGIDNYGIKKILPKIIIAAVLINLSYIICLVFVDLSNILGNGLRNIFTGLGSQLTIPTSIQGVTVDTSKGVLTAIIVLIALIGGVATAIVASGGLVAFLVSLLVVALSAIIALFFLFLLLAAREAAIVVLTVLSPLAFACYILPNTQNIFKKWYQLGWRLLMVYPIAGLLIGGGDYISKLLLSVGGGSGFFPAFVAMVAGIVPIFFIPTVLKQSFALMGGLGAKVAGLGKSMGSRVGGNLDKSIRGSERFKNYQADRERNKKLGFARRTNARLSGRQNLSKRQKDRLARARMVENAEYSDELKRQAIVDGNRYEAMRAGIEAKDRDEAVSDRLALMRSSGENGGVMVNGQRSAYTLSNLNARMQELEKASRGRSLTADEKAEMAALARGMVSEKGGAGMLNNIVRNAGNADATTGKRKLNSEFMSSMGQIYGNDSAVASKMGEKDGGMGGYMEKFMAGGDGVKNGISFDDYLSDTSDQGYVQNAARRIKSYESGLNQSGAAFEHYLGTLDYDQTQAVMDNQALLNSLDTDNRARFMEYAKNTHGITQATPRQVEIAGENQVFDVHSLDDDTLLDIATSPNISDNDPNRRAAVEELGKRNIK